MNSQGYRFLSSSPFFKETMSKIQASAKMKIPQDNENQTYCNQI